MSSLHTGLQALNGLLDQVSAAKADNAALLCIGDCPLQDTVLPIMRSPSSSCHYEAQGSNLCSGRECLDHATQAVHHCGVQQGMTVSLQVEKVAWIDEVGRDQV